ncbi:MAG: thymidine kinase [Spirochaetales bacterium]|nr:thymidine kinase [Spirochaetales bacterium]
MPHLETAHAGEDFLKSLGLPTLSVHDTFAHFDFKTPGRRVLLIGPMGSGKTEWSARVWRDAEIAKRKGETVRHLTSTGPVDRRNILFIRSELDRDRFTGYPEDAFAYRSGYIRCGENIAWIRDSFSLEEVIRDNPTVGTYIIDEASFFDERLAYVVRNASLEKGIMFIFPTLVLNFRREFFNNTARLILDIATDVIPLTAYCENSECIDPAFYTYRYYSVDGKECPALFFDPLIVVGGDRIKGGSVEANYDARCDHHHLLPGKEYTFFTLKPLGEAAARGEVDGLVCELEKLHGNIGKSELYRNLMKRYGDDPEGEVYLNSLRPGLVAEKALMYLYAEQNIISEQLLQKLVFDLELNIQYLEKTLSDNRRPVSFEQPYLL